MFHPFVEFLVEVFEAGDAMDVIYGDPRQPSAVRTSAAPQCHSPMLLLPSWTSHVVCPARQGKHGFGPVEKYVGYVKVMVVSCEFVQLCIEGDRPVKILVYPTYVV